MKKNIILILFFLILTNANSQTSIDYLQISKEIGNWIMSQAIPEKDGYKWAVSDSLPDWFSTTLANGSAGIGKFLLQLYQISGEKQFLNGAEKSAKYLINNAIKDENGTRWHYYTFVNWASTDKLGGAGGIGEFFLDLWNETKKDEYLDYAKETAKWLINTAVSSNNGFCWYIDDIKSDTSFWTGWFHGCAGIGDFFRKMYISLADSTYLKYAKGAGDWLISISKTPDLNQLAWTQKTNQIYLSDVFCNGTTGIVHYLILLYKTTGEQKYLDSAIKGGNWLISKAININNNFVWDYVNMYCHGDPSLIHILLELWQVSNNEIFKHYASGGIRWLISIKEEPSLNHFCWLPYYGADKFYFTTLLRGNAGIGYSFLKYYEITGNKEFINIAINIANWLISNAIYENDKIYWKTYTGNIITNEPVQIAPGWYEGVSGIGCFFIELIKSINNSTDIAPDINFKIKLNYINRENLILNLENLKFNAFKNNEDLKIRLFDLNGKIILQKNYKLKNENIIINLKNTTASCYFLNITLNKKTILNSRILILK